MGKRIWKGQQSVAYAFDELVTVLAEIESVINSRPLKEPLMPSHLIAGRWIHNLLDHLEHLEELEGGEFSLDASQLTRRMRYLASVLNRFWCRWRSEYLTEWREAHVYTARKQSHSSVSVYGRTCMMSIYPPRFVETWEDHISSEGTWWLCLRDHSKGWTEWSAEFDPSNSSFRKKCSHKNLCPLKIQNLMLTRPVVNHQGHNDMMIT